jgi:hypothetical protein
MAQIPKKLQKKEKIRRKQQQKDKRNKRDFQYLVG